MGNRIWALLLAIRVSGRAGTWDEAELHFRCSGRRCGENQRKSAK